MTNNDVLRRIRYTFDFDDTQMIAIFALAEFEVERGHIIAWLVKEEAPAYEECKDWILATFLNGLINQRRGKRDGPQPAAETQLGNNQILTKLKIALNLKSEDIMAITRLAGFQLSSHELSSFSRKPGHRNYRECKDQVLRKFLKGLQIKERGEPEKKTFPKWSLPPKP